MMFSPRRAVCLLFVFLYLVLSECSVPGYEPAGTCGRLECPPYDVVHSEKDYEIRSYKDALWVSSPKILAKSYTDGAYKGFNILFDYIKGKNLRHEKIDMTSPAIVDVENSSYTVYFYLPQKYQKSSIPPPLSSDIKPVKLPKYKYAAVRRFGGFITNKNIPDQIAALKKSLQATPYQRAAALGRFTVAGYDSPFKLFNRVNEVILWFD